MPRFTSCSIERYAPEQQVYVGLQVPSLSQTAGGEAGIEKQRLASSDSQQMRILESRL